MSDPGYIDRMYKDMMENYNKIGEKFLYRGCRIINMDNKQIKDEIYLINNDNHLFQFKKIWIDILEDVLNKRRFNKLKKIKSNLM